jgi:hypothetical protein
LFHHRHTNTTYYNSQYFKYLFDDITEANVLVQLNLDKMCVSNEGEATTPPTSTSSETTTNNNIILDETHGQRRPTKKTKPSPPSKSVVVESSTLSQNLNGSCSWNLATRLATIQQKTRGNESKDDNDVVVDATMIVETVLSSTSKHTEDKLRNNHCFSSSQTAYDLLQERSSGDDGAPRIPPATNHHHHSHSQQNAKLSKTRTMDRFPILPCPVSDSSCDHQKPTVSKMATTMKGHTRSPADDSQQPAFGWFVDMDENNHHHGTIPDSHQGSVPTFQSNNKYGSGTTSHTISKEDLAFHAPIAPKGKSALDDAEVEWAMAADMVDSVLGDIL